MPPTLVYYRSVDHQAVSGDAAPCRPSP